MVYRVHVHAFRKVQCIRYRISHATYMYYIYFTGGAMFIRHAAQIEARDMCWTCTGWYRIN